MSIRVLHDHDIPSRRAIRVRPGECVRVGERSPEWPAFVFVVTTNGEGWVPERHLDASRPEAIVCDDYDTQELPVGTGDLVEVLRSDDPSAWSWCRDRDGREGWVPHSALT
ncbi:SH3 domain-containing protein [Mobilicoccus massiliensis]|uniref:SH3 domain-containing protein n=1 Tax=Mobilicoccus massiliensis TaxID=1522310 RepID=UPI00058C5EE2|nr:SH3 domain-containing protein [Mobilicoccus massiliensis]